MMRIAVATRNPGKLREIRAALSGIASQIVSLDDLSISIDLKEEGKTYDENARMKAQRLLAATETYSLADDSGLEVHILDGFPGVQSARFAGAVSDADRNALLVARLRETGLPQEEWTARFRCVLAFAVPGRRRPAPVHIFRGACEGRILPEPRGDAGFGYDPIFYLPELDCTLAELSVEEKNRISHRGRALEVLADWLRASQCQPPL